MARNRKLTWVVKIADGVTKKERVKLKKNKKALFRLLSFVGKSIDQRGKNIHFVSA